MGQSSQPRWQDDLPPPWERGGAGRVVAPQTGSGNPSAVRVAAPLVRAVAPGTQRETRARSKGPDAIDELAARGAPPWLVSAVTHLLVLILLGLIFVRPVVNQGLTLEATFSDVIGVQLDDELSQVGMEPEVPEEPQVAVEPPQEVPEPVATPAMVEAPTEQAVDASQVVAPAVIGHALEGREPAAKETLRAAYGGTAQTEASVLLALDWLKRVQKKEGPWSLTGRYGHGARNENLLAATSMALLAFQGNGNTHQKGTYKTQVQRGLAALLAMQSDTGDFWQKGAAKAGESRLYAQAQATIALCELYAMSRDPKLQEPAQRAVDYAVKIQDSQGGWRYDPGDGSDTSVTGWFVMALQSARMGQLTVPDQTLLNVSAYLDSASDNGGSLYGYRPGAGHETTMTAEALLCRQYLGWRRDNPLLVAGVEHVRQFPIDWNDQNSYYWYYATQVMHHMGGTPWREWNEVLRETVPAHQQREGADAGSWSPLADTWGAHGGRLYMTCLCTYMLEVYYRHLPIYELPTNVLSADTLPGAPANEQP